MDHVGLICSIGELTGAISGSGSLEAFLADTVTMVAEHMHAQVCSIYLYDSRARRLTLRANTGLNRSRVGQVTLGYGEGLVGLALKELRPIVETHGSHHPGYRFFDDLDDDQYDSFLAVPLLRGIRRLGVLVVQRVTRHPFADDDVTAMRAVANQLATTVEYAAVLMEPGRVDTAGGDVPAAASGMYRGDVAASGFAHGPALVWERQRSLEFLAAEARQAPQESGSLSRAVEQTASQLRALQERIAERLSDEASLVFTAHLLMLKDTQFTGQMQQLVDSGSGPADAVVAVVSRYVERLSALAHAGLREKADDITDLGMRILSALGAGEGYLPAVREHVVLARNLLPSDLLVLAAEEAAGVVLVSGGIASHLSILARSLGMPTVIVDEPELLEVADNTNVLVDAEVGNVYVSPGPDVLEAFTAREHARAQSRRHAPRVSPRTCTADGTRVRLMANINLLSDLTAARELKTEGVGLYRTEFPFIVRSTFPTEEEQRVVYRRLVENMPGSDLTFRTLDVGGDKVLSYYEGHREENPFLGMRSIRFTLEHREVFVQQVRAILTAGAGAQLRIMFPMVSSLDEFLEAREVVHECRDQLRAAHIEHHESPQIGIMVELPAAVDLAHELAAEADFFSIGTNDLVQYMLAVDRTNEKVRNLYVPHHPAVLRAIGRTASAALHAGIGLSVCGDMAHRPEYIPFLLGVGIRELSVEPSCVPAVQKCIAGVSLVEARELAGALLVCRKVAEASRLVGKQSGSQAVG